MASTKGRQRGARFVDDSIKFHANIVNDVWQFALEFGTKGVNLPNFNHAVHLANDFEGQKDEVAKGVTFELLGKDASNVAYFHTQGKTFSFARGKMVSAIKRASKKST